MPLLVEQSGPTTILKLQERCSVDDIAEALPSLQANLQTSPKLQLDFSSTESIDTAIVQLLISAASSCEEFLSAEEPYFKSTLERWGIAPDLYQNR